MTVIQWAPLLLVMALLPLVVAASADTPHPKPLPLWSENVPLAKGDTDAEKPDISVYLPDPQKATGTAVVICPGGGYTALMTSYEGHDVARWLNAHGVAGMVLKYRVNQRHPAPLLDAQRAMRTVRAHAQEWHLDPKRIGVMGFSAGGHVASTVGTHFDAGNPHAADPIERVGCRPDFLILVYPVITMGPKTHAGSRDVLLGKENRSAAEEELLSNEKQVTGQTPPTFLVHAKTDSVVPVENSAMFYAALQAHHVPAEFLELSEGEHGLGAGNGALWKQWQAACLDWMAKRGLLHPGAK